MAGSFGTQKGSSCLVGLVRYLLSVGFGLQPDGTMATKQLETSMVVGARDAAINRNPRLFLSSALAADCRGSYGPRDAVLDRVRILCLGGVRRGGPCGGVLTAARWKGIIE